MRLRPSMVAAVTLASVAACTDTSFGPDTTPAAGLTLQYMQQDTPVAGQRFSGGVNVFTRDASGGPLSAQWVRVDVVGGNGTMEPDSAQTDIYGRAHFEWTLGPVAGVQKIAITSGSATKDLEVTVFPGRVEFLNINADTVQLTTSNVALPGVAAADEFGNARGAGELLWISRNQQVVQVRDGQLQPINPGMTWVIARAETYARDSLLVIVKPPLQNQ